MTTSAPLVTVVIPAYNAAPFIRSTLESVHAQSYSELEVLIVDDGSTDSTPEIVLEFARRDPRFRLIRQTNAGVGAARNRAIREARGDFIATLDADDIWHPEKIAKQVDCMIQGGDQVGLVYCWSARIDLQGQTLSKSVPVELEGTVRNALLLRNFIGCASIPMLRKRALDQVGHYLTRAEQQGAQGCEDRDLYLRIAEQFSFRVVPEHLVGYRQHEAAMSTHARGMAASFTMAMRRARARNPDVSDRLFRWAVGGFYRFLMRKTFLWRHYRWSLHCMQRAIRADPVLLLSSEVYLLLCKCVLRTFSLHGHGPTPRKPAGHPAVAPSVLRSRFAFKAADLDRALFKRIERKRWKQVVDQAI